MTDDANIQNLTTSGTVIANGGIEIRGGVLSVLDGMVVQNDELYIVRDVDSNSALRVGRGITSLKRTVIAAGTDTASALALTAYNDTSNALTVSSGETDLLKTRIAGTGPSSNALVVSNGKSIFEDVVIGGTLTYEGSLAASETTANSAAFTTLTVAGDSSLEDVTAATVYADTHGRFKELMIGTVTGGVPTDVASISVSGAGSLDRLVLTSTVADGTDALYALEVNASSASLLPELESSNVDISTSLSVGTLGALMNVSGTDVTLGSAGVTTTIAGTLDLSAASITGTTDLTVGTSFTSTGTSALEGATTIGTDGTLATTQMLQVYGKTTMTGNATVSGTLTSTGTLTASNGLTVSGGTSALKTTTV
ncbi:MAG: hypothetical protein VXY56_08800, partial [Pseudomonadota bacterium]|nr:hypothetical protein [Pseudomonadota bacterium]